jgi:hypothetical protein
MNIDSRLNQRQGITQMITRIRPAYLAALTVALGLFLASHAFATVQPNTPTPVATANADASAGAVATSNSGSFSTASTGPSNANANNAISFEDRLQAPALLAAAVYPSGLCASGGSLGISVPGGAISGGRTKNENESCARREWFRLLSADHPALALAIACSDPIVKAAAGEKLCDYKPAPAPQPCAVCEPKDTYTKQEVDAKVEKAFRSTVAK